MSLRAGFLIVAAALVLNLSYWQTGLVLAGYFGFARIDEWLANRARAKVIDDEVIGWTVDADNPDHETHGNWSRVRLPQNEQVVLWRVAELLRKLR
jgi:hypothetical protein